MEIKPIETIYKGYKFRSRAEARWAVFFDSCDIKWEYEPEGYDLGNGLYYLPDFLLHGVGIRGSEKEGKLYDLYVEVKGVITEKDIKKVGKFCGRLICEDEDCLFPTFLNMCERPIIVVGSKIPEDYHEMIACWVDNGNFYSFFYIDSYNSPALLFIKDRKIVVKDVGDGSDSDYISQCIYDVDEKATEKALARARSARFEHGEQPI